MCACGLHWKEESREGVRAKGEGRHKCAAGTFRSSPFSYSYIRVGFFFFACMRMCSHAM